MNEMVSALVLSILAAVFQTTSLDVVIVTVPPDSRVDIPLTPNVGEVEARRGETQTRLEVRIDALDPLTAFGESMHAYVVWAVSPEGEFENLGELEVDGREAEIDTATSLQRFGLLITAEPYFSVKTPGASVAFTSATPRDNDVRIEMQSIEVGRYDYSTATLRPQGSIAPHVIQARMAFLIAQQEGAEGFADSEFRQARVAVDSMEQLLLRGMNAEVVEAYVNDALRLSARAIQTARDRRIEIEMDSVQRRVESLQRDNDRMNQEIPRLDLRQEEAARQIELLRSDLQAARSENRQISLERDESDRQLRTAQAEIEMLSDKWVPLLDAMIAAGARQTADGVQFTLPAQGFEEDEAEFSEGTPEILAHLAGLVTFDFIPDILIEGHVSDRGPATNRLTLSVERAEAVKTYFVEAGVPENMIRAEGFGLSRPVPGTEDLSSFIHERVDIIFPEP
jgi:outer membrane protein OmpA-like peptidoglycan-associated protein